MKIKKTFIQSHKRDTSTTQFTKLPTDKSHKLERNTRKREMVIDSAL